MAKGWGVVPSYVEGSVVGAASSVGVESAGVGGTGRWRRAGTWFPPTLMGGGVGAASPVGVESAGMGGAGRRLLLYRADCVDQGTYEGRCVWVVR